MPVTSRRPVDAQDEVAVYSEAVVNRSSGTNKAGLFNHWLVDRTVRQSSGTAIVFVVEVSGRITEPLPPSSC